MRVLFILWNIHKACAESKPMRWGDAMRVAGDDHIVVPA